MAQPKRATFLIEFPIIKEAKVANVVNDLLWWNNHYRNMHQWKGGRVEVLYNRALRDFHKSNDHLHINCPYCKKHCNFHPKSIDKVKGDITCPFCKEKYGVNPNGQMYVIRKTEAKVASTRLGDKELVKWIKENTHYMDVDVMARRKGDDGIFIDVEWFGDEDDEEQDTPSLRNLRELKALLDGSVFEVRRYA